LNRAVGPIAAPQFKTLNAAISSASGQILTLSLSTTDVRLFVVRAVPVFLRVSDDISLTHLAVNPYSFY